MIQQAINEIISKNNLSETTMIDVMTEIMNGEVSETLLASFLTALRIKGETADEIAGAAKVMREKADKVDLSDFETMDTCGTGGDKSGTFNISTGVAFVLATAGVKVVKHGNRSITSQCGSADVLEALNVNINLDKEKVRQCVLTHNLGFFFAPKFHQAMKYAMPVRKALGFRTLFNVLGPLSNPALATNQLLGVFDGSLTEIMAEALNKLGVKHALVVYGEDGLDEITLTTSTKVTELKNGQINSFTINPEEFGFVRVSLEHLKGGTKEENAQTLIELFQGAQGPKRHILVLNSGAALYAANQVNSIEEGIIQAETLLDNGSVYEKLKDFVQYTEVIA
jgi:anthranilate phosphoribosyltransferase